MKGRKGLPPVFTVVCIVVLVCVVLFAPRSVLRDPVNSHIVSIEYNRQYGTGDGFVTLEGYDEEAVRELLHDYKERRSLSKETGYAAADVQLRILVDKGRQVREILLGEINYSSAGHGSEKFNIHYYDDLRNALLEQLDY